MAADDMDPGDVDLPTDEDEERGEWADLLDEGPASSFGACTGDEADEAYDAYYRDEDRYDEPTSLRCEGGRAFYTTD